MMTDWEEKYKQELAARQEAQLQLEYYKGRLAKARLDVMRELKEQGWTRTEGPQLTADSITVNLMRLAGLDKHKARECEQIMRALVDKRVAAIAADREYWPEFLYSRITGGHIDGPPNDRVLVASPAHGAPYTPQQCTYPQCGCRNDLGTDWMACKP